MWRAEDPWSTAEHLAALSVDRLTELVWAFAYVNSDEKARKRMKKPPAPLPRPGDTHRHAKRRERRGPPISPAEFGAEPIDVKVVDDA